MRDFYVPGIMVLLRAIDKLSEFTGTIEHVYNSEISMFILGEIFAQNRFSKVLTARDSSQLATEMEMWVITNSRVISSIEGCAR